MASSSEILFGTDWEEGLKIMSLREIVKMISVNHADEYDRHLNNLRYRELEQRYGTIVDECWEETKKKLNKLKYGPRRYIVTELKDFNVARQFYDYTVPHGWCHLSHESTLNSYRRNNTVRLYIAVLPGFETITEDDPLYGESMLGIDVGKDGRLVHVNNRWNHDHDHIDKRKGDNKYSAEELSLLMGAPFYKLCKPFSPYYYAHLEGMVERENKRRTERYERTLKDSHRVFMRGRKNTVGPIRKFVDRRDGNEYRTRRIGRTTWMLDPLQYRVPGMTYDIPSSHEYNGILGVTHSLRGVNPYATTDNTYIMADDDYGDSTIAIPAIEYSTRFEDGTEIVSRKHDDLCADICKGERGDGYIYRRSSIEKAIPEGWRLPTLDEFMELLGYFGANEDAYEHMCPKPPMLKLDTRDPHDANGWTTAASIKYDPIAVNRVDAVMPGKTGFNEALLDGNFPMAKITVADFRQQPRDVTPVSGSPWTTFHGEEAASAIRDAARRATEFMHSPSTITVNYDGHIVTATGENESCTVDIGCIDKQVYTFTVGSGVFVHGRKLACDYRDAEGEDMVTTVKLSKDGQFSVDHVSESAAMYYICTSSNINAGRLFLVKDQRRNL